LMCLDPCFWKCPEISENGWHLLQTSIVPTLQLKDDTYIK
jgi:hypothetical protein